MAINKSTSISTSVSCRYFIFDSSAPNHLPSVLLARTWTIPMHSRMTGRGGDPAKGRAAMSRPLRTMWRR